ncbi:hypothetical protein CMEL01_07328, partial [Colletotrichum melonis]
RKLKCNEVRPACGQCTKSDRECIFSQDTKFRHFDHSLLCRGQDKASAGRVVVENLFEEDQTWLDIPHELVFVNVTNPFEADDDISDDDFLLQHDCHNTEGGPSDELGHTLSTPEPRDAESGRTPAYTSRSEGVSEFAQQSSDDLRMNSDVVQSRPVTASVGNDDVLNPVALPSPTIQADDDEDLDDNGDNDDSEMNIIALKLLRHFRQGPGQWMDLFDTSAHFSCKIPIRATTRPLLKSAICALAAKHLSRTQSNDNEIRQTRSARASVAPSATTPPDWQYHAVRHYHQAIRHLKHAITFAGARDDALHSETSDQHADTFAAVAILCMYELMNAPGNAWKAHLTALSLYSASDRALGGSSPVSIPQSPTKGPIFWSLARQDFLCAFISETQTRLNLDHIRLWQNFGLATDERNLLLPFSPFSTADIRSSTNVDEDSKSNELLWLLGKIVNYMTNGDGIRPEDYSKPAGQRMSLGLTQELLLGRWTKLEVELQEWYESLPPTFVPSARTRFSSRHGDLGDDETDMNLERVWYDIPMCASTMQSYHMAQILLLVNRPQESTAIRSTVSARLRSYRLIQKGVLRHCKEICGISLADPTDAVRVHSVQPLFVAGQAFYTRPEQELVLELLSGIETELGWATNHQRRKLIDEWKVNDG